MRDVAARNPEVMSALFSLAKPGDLLKWTKDEDERSFPFSRFEEEVHNWENPTAVALGDLQECATRMFGFYGVGKRELRFVEDLSRLDSV